MAEGRWERGRCVECTLCCSRGDCYRAQPQVGMATRDGFCTKWYRFVNLPLLRELMLQYNPHASENNGSSVLRVRHLCFWKSGLFWCMTLTQDKRMSDVLWFVVWAGEVQKAELCIKSEFNSLCAKRFTPTHDAHTDHTQTHTVPLFFSRWLCYEGWHASRGSGGEVLVQMCSPGWLLRLEAFNRSRLCWKTT